MFRDETGTTIRKLGRRPKAGQDTGLLHLFTRATGTNQKLNEVQSMSETPKASKVYALLAAKPSISLEIQMDIPCSEQSLSLFFHQYVAQGDGEIPGMNEFLPLYYQEAQPNSCMKHCVAATAYASLANQSKSVTVGRKAWEFYGTALSSVNAALADPVESVKDETLAALFILSMFENISGQQLHIFGIHGSGMDRLLHFRGPPSLATTNGKRIVKAVCSYLQIRNLSMGRRPSPQEDFWIKNLDFPVPYRRAMLSTSRICHIMADAEDLLFEINSDSSDRNDASLGIRFGALTGIIAEMRAIQNDHWLWSQDAPDSWGYVNSSSTGVEPDNVVHIYRNLGIANHWNWTRSSCILLQSSLLRCLAKLSSISNNPHTYDSLETDAQQFLSPWAILTAKEIPPKPRRRQ